ncbi:hypothetical protein BKA80DRAFT_338100 [Phyllosticta citrichinensis]
MASTSPTDRPESPTVNTAPTPDHLQALSKTFSSYGRSDLTIRTNDGGEFRVHKNVVCRKCEFFDNAVNGPFKEAASGIVEMPNDPPTAIAATLQFLYEDRYECFVDKDQPSSTRWRFHLDAYIAATILNIPELKNYAKCQFTGTLFGDSVAFEVIPKAISILYESTPDTDRILRDWIEHFSFRYLDNLLTDPEFLEVMATVDSFRNAIAHATSTERTRVERVEDHVFDLQYHLDIRKYCGEHGFAYYSCPDDACGYKMMIGGPDSLDTVYCPGCKEIWHVDDWTEV